VKLSRRARRLGIVTGRAARSSAWVIQRLRYLLVPGWIVVAVLAATYLPGPSKAQSSLLGTLIPRDAPALQAEARSVQHFGLPLLARSAVVQRNPKALSPEAQVRIYQRAVQVGVNRPKGLGGIAGALPITNTLKLFPGSRESSTTGITYLYFDPTLPLDTQRDLALRYAAQANRPGDALIGVTGPVPARVEQGDLITRSLPMVELATVLVIALILGLSFRSIGAPLATLAAAAIAYIVAIRVVSWAGAKVGVYVPQELEPVIVVLVLGIVTDYAVFFLFGMRDRLWAGQRRRHAAEATTADFLPIIFTAGLTVAAGTATLYVASLQFIRSFGPALAVTVLVALVVAITFLPSVLGIFGRLVYWPHWHPPVPKTTQGEPATTRGGERAGRKPGDGVRAALAGSGWRDRLSRVTTVKPIALAITVIVLAGLAVAASGLWGTRLAFGLISGLPHSSSDFRAEQAAARGFAPGIVSPTEILLEGAGLSAGTNALSRLEDVLGKEPGVSGVIGPREQSIITDLAGRAGVGTHTNTQDLGITISRDGTAARYVVILDREPLGAGAIDVVRRLEDRMPALLRSSGLSSVRASFAGDTALAADTVERTLEDLGRIAVAIVVVDLLLLIMFLRSLVAPLYLLAASLMALLASLGLTTYVFQGLLGHDHLTYYVPFAVSVLLVSLGSDYNIFIVGRMWEEARQRPIREAIAVGSRRATRPITIAGLTLAASFALLAIVPIEPFREFAFAMVVGVLIDSFVVRSFLVPALVSLFGRTSFWPWHLKEIARQPAASPRVNPQTDRAAAS
jgi:putative drug exporter of the RND superfamily